MCLYCGITCGSGLTDENGLPDVGSSGFVVTTTHLEISDAANSQQTAYNFAGQEAFKGTLSADDDADWIEISTSAEHRYQFLFSADAEGQEFDISLYDADGVAIDFRIETVNGTDQLISYDAVSDGPIFVEISAGSDGAEGGYEVAAADAAPLMEFTASEIAHQLTNGYWTSKGARRHKFDVNSNGDITVDITKLNADGKALARAALETWEKYSGLNFIYGNKGNNADINFNDENGGAYASYSSWGNETVSTFVNVSKSWVSYYGTTLDSYSFQTYLHEIGHALGLGHAGNYNGSADYQEDGTGSNHYLNDSWQMTVMSYFAQYENTTVDASFAYIVTPMIADIVAIQDLYSSLNAQHKTGNTAYDLFGSNTSVDYAGLTVGNRPVAMTIYDTGGIDTFDFRATSADQMIDLAKGAHSDIDGRKGNLSIDVNTVIENARGGGGDDDIFGNAADNKLCGHQGRDRLEGRGGDDKLRGGWGNDTLDGGGGNDIFVGGLGQDRFIFESGDGADRVKRFENGQDVFDLRGTSASAFSDLTIVQSGTSVDISVDDISISVKKASVALFDAGDFLFA